MQKNRRNYAISNGFAHTIYIKTHYVYYVLCRSRFGECLLTLRKWKKFRGSWNCQFNPETPKHTERYSSHLHLHLQTKFSHSRYSKQTSLWMETCATLITHVHALCTHTPLLPPASITLCLQSIFFFLDDHIPCSANTMLLSHVLSF